MLICAENKKEGIIHFVSYTGNFANVLNEWSWGILSVGGMAL